MGKVKFLVLYFEHLSREDQGPQTFCSLGKMLRMLCEHFSHPRDREVKYMTSFAALWIWAIPMLDDAIPGETRTNICSPQIRNWGPIRVWMPPKSTLSFLRALDRIVGEDLQEQGWLKDSCITRNFTPVWVATDKRRDCGTHYSTCRQHYVLDNVQIDNGPSSSTGLNFF